MKKTKFKRKYEQRLIQRVIGTRENRTFLIEHFKKEWEAVERTRKEMEQEIDNASRRRRHYETAKEVGTVLGLTLLGMAAVCGILTVAVVAPNAVAAFGRIHRRHSRRYFDKSKFEQRMQYYVRRRYIKIRQDGTEPTKEVRLTKFGEDRLVQYELGKLKILPQVPWDGVWRLVIFDIPEQNRWTRDGVRASLKRMGFYQVQKSTFIFPYPCRKEVEFLERVYGTGRHLRYIETRVISYEEDLRKFFSI